MGHLTLQKLKGKEIIVCNIVKTHMLMKVKMERMSCILTIRIKSCYTHAEQKQN